MNMEKHFSLGEQPTLLPVVCSEKQVYRTTKFVSEVAVHRWKVTCGITDSQKSLPTHDWKKSEHEEGWPSLISDLVTRQRPILLLQSHADVCLTQFVIWPRATENLTLTDV